MKRYALCVCLLAPLPAFAEQTLPPQGLPPIDHLSLSVEAAPKTTLLLDQMASDGNTMGGAMDGFSFDAASNSSKTDVFAPDLLSQEGGPVAPLPGMGFGDK